MAVIFGMITLILGVILTTIGNVYLDWVGLVFFNFDSDFGILNILQGLNFASIILTLIFGIICVNKKNTKVFAIIYSIATAFAIITISWYLVTLSTNATIGITANSAIWSGTISINLATIVLGCISLVGSIAPMFLVSLKRKDGATQKKGVSSNQRSPKKEGSSLNRDFPTDDTTNSIEAGPTPQDFTSSPNEATFNIADKLAKLKDDINNNNFQEGFFDEGELESNSAPQPQQEPENFDDFRDIEPQVEKQNNETKPEGVVLKENAIVHINQLDEISYNKGPLDPYKQTIVPRRSSTRASEFNKPIGNVANPQNAPKTKRKTPRVDENYQGKVFLGDSDRIWEAMKNQERRIKPQYQNNSSSNNSDVVNNLKQEKTKTMEIDIDKIKDPVNERTVTDSDPTIDWDD